MSMMRTRVSPIPEGIGHLLRDRRLRVPPYQRPYSWSESEVEALWQDLNEALALADPEYFLGTVVLTEPSNGVTTIIDGQQRIATVALLFAAIRDVFLERGDEDRSLVTERDYLASKSLATAKLERRLSLNAEDDEYFQVLLLSSDESAFPPPKLSSHSRLLAARKYLRDRVRGEVDKARANWAHLLLRWTEFLDDRARVIVVTVVDDADAFVIFETLNDRGLDLTVADLLRNHLFSLADSKLPVAQRGWQSAVARLDRPAEDSSFVTFLRHYWSSFHGATRERDLYRSLKREIADQKTALTFINELSDAAPLYAALRSAEDETWEEMGIDSRLVDTLLRLELEQNRPLLIAAMQVFPPDALRALVKAIVSWSVRGLVVGGIGGGTTERYYADAAIQVRQGRTATIAKVERLLDPILPSDDEFEEAFSRIRATRARLARYYLLGIENSIAGKPDPALVGRDEEAAAALVYILPRNADSNAWPEFSEDELAQMTLRLGNRALVPAASRRLFEQSDWEARRNLLSESPFAISRMITELMPWGPESIRERQRAMAGHALRVWSRTT